MTSENRSHFVRERDLNFLNFRFVRILDDKTDGQAYNLYWTCETKCRQAIQRFLCYGCFHLPTFIPILILVLFDIFNGEFDGSAYNFPFNTSVPFDAESILGWLFIYLYQLSECASYFIGMMAPTSCFICCCWYVIAMCKQFEQLIESIRFLSRQTKIEKNSRNRQRLWLNAKGKLQQAIELHVDIYE